MSKFTKTKFIFFTILFFGIFGFAESSEAATYYVSTAGSDSNNGTSTGAPWRTIAKVNASSFLPGDFILFKKGETWREQLTVPSSGSAGNHITFGAYGSGANPVFYGSSTIASGSWTANDPVSGVWSYTTYQRFAVWEDNVPILKATSSSCTDGNWYYGGGKMYYKPTTGTLTDHVVELYDTHIEFNLNNKSYLTIDSLSLTKSKAAVANSPTLAGAHSHDITIKNSTFTNNLNSVFVSTDNTTSTSVTVSNNTFDYNSQSIFVGGYGPDAESYPHNTDNVTISNNTITHCSQAYGAVGYDWMTLAAADYEGIGTQNITNSNIYNNVISGTCRGIVFYTANAGTSYNNNIFSNSINTTRCGIAVITAQTSNTDLYNNRIYYNLIYGTAADEYTWSMTGVMITDTTSTGTINRFYNNVMNGNLSNLRFIGAGGTNNTYYWEVKNNIFSNPTNQHIGEYPAPAAGNVTYDYNLYYPAGSNSFYTGGTTHNYAFWKALDGRDAHSTTDDPLFVSGSDFSLQSGSPAINAGVNVGLTTDYLGNAIVGLPDIGAYEYASGDTTPPAAPQGLSVS